MNDGEFDDCWNRIGVWATSQKRTCPRLQDVVHCANCDVFSRAGKILLEEEAPVGYLDEWAEILSARKKNKNYDSSSIIIFRLGDEWLGIETSVLDEVVSIRPVHTVPHRKGAVLKGLTNIRGELQLCVSMGRLMNVTRGEITGSNVVKGVYERMVVMSFGGGRFVFPVSEIRGIYRYSEVDVGSAPATSANSSVHYLRGMIDVDGRHVGVIDHELLFDALKRAIL